MTVETLARGRGPFGGGALVGRSGDLYVTDGVLEVRVQDGTFRMTG
jgi:hypothetical protein